LFKFNLETLEPRLFLRLGMSVSSENGNRVSSLIVLFLYSRRTMHASKYSYILAFL